MMLAGRVAGAVIHLVLFVWMAAIAYNRRHDPAAAVRLIPAAAALWYLAAAVYFVVLAAAGEH